MERSCKQNILEDYEPLIGSAAVERIMEKAQPLKDRHVDNINSTYYGGGVAELLSSMTLLMNNLGINTGWLTIQGSPDFFAMTKQIHNALQGHEIDLDPKKKEIYDQIICENAMRNHHLDDFVIVHDPQPIGMIDHYKKKGPWIWRCHIDVSNPDRNVWKFLEPYIEKYDAAIFSIKEYEKPLNVPQLFIMPAINPFSIKNKKMSTKEINERLEHYKIPTDLPLVVQISRFDKFKDPQGVIEAFKIARKQVDSTLVLLGNVATDDPEGMEVYDSLLGAREERIILLSVEDTWLVNALQTKADVIVQKSLKEGFGLTVAEAMWKGTPVIGGNVGGIRYQIEDGVNGFLVSSIEETADRIVEVLKDKKLRKQLGHNAIETVKKNFLMTRKLEQYLDLLNSFETIYRIKRQ